MPWEPLPGSRPEPDHLGRSLDRVVRSLGGPGVDVLGTVFSRWDELVGDQLAGRTEPRSLRDGRLVVAVDDPAWASQVRYLVPDLLDRVAGAVGEGQVTGIDVVVARPGGSPGNRPGGSPGNRPGGRSDGRGGGSRGTRRDPA